MATILEIISARAPHYTGDPRLDTLIEISEQRTSENELGEHYNNAVALRTLHMLALSDKASIGGGAVAGPVSTEKQGQLTRSYHSNSSNTSNNNSDLSQTSWGIELESLLMAIIIPFGDRVVH